MSQPYGSIWVDPEGVIGLGDSYDQHIASYDAYLRQLSHLRARYAPAWGDDDLGNQFQKQFGQTLDAIEGIILGVKGSLEYAAVGLRLSGEGYQQADEDANQAGRMIGSAFSELPVQFAATESPATEPPGDVPPAAHQAGLPVTNLRPVSATVATRETPLEPTELMATNLRPVSATVATRGVPLEPAEARQREALAPVSFTPTTLATSSYLDYSNVGALIDGEPIPSGFQLQTLSTFPDGTSRVDANHYDSIVPVGTQHRVTGPDGHPVGSEGDRFFLVRPAQGPAPDPTSPDYRPLLISFHPDGTAVPLLTDPS